MRLQRAVLPRFICVAGLCCVNGVGAFSLHPRRPASALSRTDTAAPSTQQYRPPSYPAGSSSKRSLCQLQTFPETAAFGDSSWSSSLLLGSSNNIGNAVLQSSNFWSCAIMLSIVALLFTWEETVKSARERLPATLMPVVDSMLAEMGGLGFIGLFLGIVVKDGPLGGIVGELSERFLGKEEILLETFEFLHTAFFEVGIAFFLVAGLTVAKVLYKIDSLQAVSQAVFDTSADGNACLDDLANVLQVDTLKVDLDGDGDIDDEEVTRALRTAPRDSLWEEVTMTTRQIKAEALVVRERFLRTCRVSPSFRIEKYFVKIFGENLQEMVELSPLTWLPLIPTLSIGRSVDMSRDVVSAASANAAESCGLFLDSPLFFWSSSAVALLSLVWGCWNFYKVTSIKEMLTPLLVRDANAGGEATLLPPRYQDEKLLQEFNSSPSIFGWLESRFGGEPARNDHEKLFGVAGAAFPELYRDSIKLQTWLTVTEIVFWGTQIVVRDATALLRGSEMGNPDLVVPELAIFGLYVANAIGQLWLAPQTFLNYCLVTSIEELASDDAITESCFMVNKSKDRMEGVQLGALEVSQRKV